VYPGVKLFPRHFDAAVVYYESAQELEDIKDIMERYRTAPISAMLGSVAANAGNSFTGKSFTIA